MSYIDYLKLFDRVAELEKRERELEARIAELAQQLKSHDQEPKRGRPRKTPSSD